MEQASSAIVCHGNGSIGDVEGPYWHTPVRVAGDVAEAVADVHRQRAARERAPGDRGTAGPRGVGHGDMITVRDQQTGFPDGQDAGSQSTVNSANAEDQSIAFSLLQSVGIVE